MICPRGGGATPPQTSRGGERQGSALGSALGPSPQPCSGGEWASDLKWPPPGPVDPLPLQSPLHTSCCEVACFPGRIHLPVKDQGYTWGKRFTRMCSPLPPLGRAPSQGRQSTEVIQCARRPEVHLSRRKF